MTGIDAIIAVPKSHPRSFQDVLARVRSLGLHVCAEMPHLGTIAVHVHATSDLDPLRAEGLAVELSRQDVAPAPPTPPQPEPGPAPFSSPGAPPTPPGPWSSPLSEG